jgi:hypothetical protein
VTDDVYIIIIAIVFDTELLAVRELEQWLVQRKKEEGLIVFK